MYVYLRAALRGNTGVEKEETLLSPSLSPPPATPHRVSSSRYLLSSYSIFTHRTGSLSLSPSTPCSSATRLRTLSLFLYRSPFLSPRSLTPVSAPLSLTLFFLSSSFIRDYASRIAYRSGADMLLPLRCKLLMKPQGARASTCKRKGNAVLWNIKTNICLNPRYTLNGY